MNAAAPAAIANVQTPQQVPPAVRKAADDFEAMFLSEMLGHMFSEIPVNEMFGGGAGEKIFRSLLVNEYSKNMVKAGGIGISAAVQQEILSLQERAAR